MSDESNIVEAAEPPVSTVPARELTMQDRLLVAAHIEILATEDSTLRVIADTVIDCVRCCDYFPECAHVVGASERIDLEEDRIDALALTQTALPSPASEVSP